MAEAQTYRSEFTGEQMDQRFTAVAALTEALEELTTVVAGKYVKPADGIPSTDMTAAVQASLAKAESAVQSLADYYTKTEVDQLLAAINGMDYVDVSTLPTASASTMGKIYLVGPDGSGYYSYYYTSYNGSAYSWVGPLGTTEISLAGYATKDELNQLDQKITGNVYLGSWEIGSIDAPSNGHIPDYSSTTRLRIAEQVCTKAETYKITCNSGYLFLIYVVGKITTVTWSNSREVALVPGDIYRIAIKTDPETNFSGYTQTQVDAVIAAANIQMHFPGIEDRLDDLEDVGEKVDAIVDGTQVQSPNLFDKSTATDGYAIDNRDGAPFSSSGYSYSSYIAIPEGATSIYIDKATGAGIRGWACYNSSKVYTHGSNSTKQISVQSGDAYFRFTVATTDKGACMAIVGTSADVPSEYMPYGTITAYKLKDDSVSFDSIAFKVTETGKNKLNPAEVVADKYIDQTDGVAYTYSGDEPTSVTGYIFVSKNGLYFNRYLRAGAAMGAAVYNSSKQYIRACGQSYSYQDGDAYVRYTFRTAYLSDAQVEEGNVGTGYEAYAERQIIDPDYLPMEESPEALKVFLPNTLYAVVGDTLQLFFQSLVRSVDVSNYNVRVSCSKGKQYRRYFEYSPSAGDVGTVTFRVTVIDDFGKTLGTASCQLVTVAAGNSPSSSKKIVCVGASTTANGKWPAETFRRLTGSGGTPAGDGKSNIVFCGNQTKDGAGFVGNSGWGWVDYATEGRPAFRFTISPTANVAIGNVYTNNGYSYTVIEISDNGTILCSTSSASNTPQASGTLTRTAGSGDATVAFTASAQDSQNPFWDYQNEKLTFESFADTYCGGTIDAIYIWLGANGLSNWQTNFATFRGYMETFADTLHSEYPSAKLYLIQGTIPSMRLMMPGYGADGSGYADTFGMVDSFFNLRKFYQEFANDSDYSGFVEYVDGASQFDSDYNFPLTQKAVNTRNNSVTEPYANNTVHPGDPGYMQVADAVYRHFVAKFCQS